MAEGIRDKVAIVGMGCTRFGELWDKGAPDLIIEATNEAFEDAGIGINDIGAIWGANQFEFTAIGALPYSIALKSPSIPVTRVENMCASGTEGCLLCGGCWRV